MGNIIISKLLIIAVILLFYYLLIKSLTYLLPFIIGWIISLIIEPFVNLLHKRLKIFRGLSTFISLSLFIGTSFFVITSIGNILFTELTKLYNRLPTFTSKLINMGYYLIDKYEAYNIYISPTIMETISNSISSLLNNITKYIGSIIASAINIFSVIPNVFVFLVVTFISSFFFSKDREKIKRFIYSRFPVHLLRHKNFLIIRSDLIFALWGYIKAQLILMTINFTVSSIGLYLIGVDYSFLIAFGISFLDALPIFGSGTVYIPWIIVNLLFKDFKKALFLGIIYIIVTLIRQTLEPKIISSQIGIYPLLTLLGMYLGLKLFGFIGLILGPIVIVFFAAIKKTGILPKWKSTR